MPKLQEYIRQELGKKNWKFELNLKRSGKKKSAFYQLWLNANELPTTIEKELSCTRLGLCVDMNGVQYYLMELVDEILEEIRKIHTAKQRQQIKDLIRDYWEEIGRKGQQCVNIYFKKLFGNNAKFVGVLNCNRYEDKKVNITVSYLGMTFSCDTFSGKSIASFFQETTWLKQYLMITKQDDCLFDLICVDWDAAIAVKLKKFEKKLDQIIGEGIPFDLSEIPVAYRRELQDKAKEYNRWRISWLDGFAEEMEEFVDGRLYVDQQEVIFANGAGKITVSKNATRYMESECFKEYQNLKKSKLRERCRQYALENFSGFGQIKCELKNSGILNGDTKLTFQMDSIPSFSYQYKTIPYHQSVSEWKKTLQKNVKQIQMLAAVTKEKRKNELKKRYQLYWEFYLVRDIFECVFQNETYITQNAIVQILRGTKVTLNADIRTSRGDGLYGFYSADEISDTVTKMLDLKILTSKEIKGTYGYFDILKIPSKTKLELEELNVLIKDEEDNWTETKQEEISNNLRRGCAISDIEAEQFLLHGILENEKEANTYMDLINLASHPVVLRLHEMDIQKYFADAPKQVIKFLKLRYKSVSTREKKILKQFFLSAI